jgi:hypothetical protein
MVASALLTRERASLPRGFSDRRCSSRNATPPRCLLSEEAAARIAELEMELAARKL